MTYRFYASLVLAISVTAITYILVADDSGRSVSSCMPTDVGGHIHIEKNQKIGELLTSDFQFRNTRGKKIVVTSIKPQVYGVDVKCDATFPKEMSLGDTLDFSLTVKTGAVDSEKIAGAYVYWKHLDSEQENVQLFVMTYHRAHEWILDSTTIELGELKVGADIDPVQVEVRKLKDSNFNVETLEFEAQEGVKGTAVSLEKPENLVTKNSITRQHCGNVVIQLPSPWERGGYVRSITVKDPQSGHVEVIQINGTVAR